MLQIILITLFSFQIFNQSMLSLFSLLYGDVLEAMGHNTQGAALVLSTMLFVTNFGGPIAGAVVKLTTTRFVAFTGAISCTLGIFFSGFATNIWHLVITYGILLGKILLDRPLITWYIWILFWILCYLCLAKTNNFLEQTKGDSSTIDSTLEIDKRLGDIFPLY